MAEWEPNEQYLFAEVRALADDIKIRPIPVISDHVRKARSKPPPFYDFDGSEIEVQRCHPGRGYSMNDVFRRPGGKPSFYEQEKKFVAEIRQATGDSYSNEIIEQALKSGKDVAPSVVPSFPKFRPASKFNESANPEVEQGTAAILKREISGKTRIDNDLISGSFNIK